MKILRVGDGIGEGSWAFHSRFRRSLNFFDGESLTTLVLPDIGAAPHALVVDELPETEAECLTVGSGRVEIAGRCFSLNEATVYHSRPTWGFVEPARVAARLGCLVLFLGRAAPDGSLAWLVGGGGPPRSASAFDREAARRADEGAKALTGDDPARGAAQLHGLGKGLTPAGDDFLAGCLHGWRLRETWWGEDHERRVEAVYSVCREAKNPFVVSFLREARAGRLFERLERLVRALLDGGNHGVEPAASGLLAVGATSGADLAAGLVLALKGGASLSNGVPSS